MNCITGLPLFAYLVLAHHPVQHAQLSHGVAHHHHGVGGEPGVKVVETVQEYQSFRHLQFNQLLRKEGLKMSAFIL